MTPLLAKLAEIRERAKGVPCPDCQGEGKVVVGEYRVTHDMAIDAGDRSLEGAFHSYEYAPCDKCEGAGLTPPDPEKVALCDALEEARQEAIDLMEGFGAKLVFVDERFLERKAYLDSRLLKKLEGKP